MPNFVGDGEALSGFRLLLRDSYYNVIAPADQNTRNLVVEICLHDFRTQHPRNFFDWNRWCGDLRPFKDVLHLSTYPRISWSARAHRVCARVTLCTKLATTGIWLSFTWDALGAGKSVGISSAAATPNLPHIKAS